MGFFSCYKQYKWNFCEYIMIHWVDLLLSVSGVGHLGSICLICAVGFIFTFRYIKFFLEAKR